MRRHLLGAAAGLALLTAPAHAAFYVVADYGPPEIDTFDPLFREFLEYYHFPGETLTWLGGWWVNADGSTTPFEPTQGTMTLSYANPQRNDGTWAYTPTPPHTLRPNLFTVFGEGSGIVYAAVGLPTAGVAGGTWSLDDTSWERGAGPADSDPYWGPGPWHVAALHVTPLPAAAWLFGAGVAGLAGWRHYARTAAA